MKKPSLRKQIDKFCKECIYDGSNGSGTWKQQVLNCTAKECPLYHLRPLPAGVVHKWAQKVPKQLQLDVKLQE